jgi:polyisoprenoid-binding protein YceI
MATEAATITKWAVDPMHSEIQFKVKHLVISTVTGFFRGFEGSMETEGDNFEDAQISFAINIDSIDTNQTQRDAHLKSPDFFDAEKYPQITFKSTSFKKTGEDDEYKLTGDLTVKGITKQVTLDAEFGGSADDFYGNTKAGFEVSGKINRKEFGLTWDAVTEAGSVVVGDDIKLIINVQFAKQK